MDVCYLSISDYLLLQFPLLSLVIKKIRQFSLDLLIAEPHFLQVRLYQLGKLGWEDVVFEAPDHRRQFALPRKRKLQ